MRVTGPLVQTHDSMQEPVIKGIKVTPRHLTESRFRCSPTKPSNIKVFRTHADFPVQTLSRANTLTEDSEPQDRQLTSQGSDSLLSWTTLPRYAYVWVASVYSFWLSRPPGSLVPHQTTAVHCNATNTCCLTDAQLEDRHPNRSQGRWFLAKEEWGDQALGPWHHPLWPPQ